MQINIYAICPLLFQKVHLKSDDFQKSLKICKIEKYFSSLDENADFSLGFYNPLIQFSLGFWIQSAFSKFSLKFVVFWIAGYISKNMRYRKIFSSARVVRHPEAIIVITGTFATGTSYHLIKPSYQFILSSPKSTY